MSGPSGEACRYCYYCADPGAADEYMGICLRYPALKSDSDTTDERRVWTSLNTWCGEFKLHPRMGKHLWRHLPHGLVHAETEESK